LHTKNQQQPLTIYITTETTYDDLLARITALVETTERIPVVGISGHGGAGKSTLATALCADLGFARELVLSIDSFKAVTCGPDAGMWEQHDWEQLAAVVRGARRSPRPERLRYDYRWWTGETGSRDLPMPPVLIVEGIRLLGDRTRDWFDLTVWIDMDPDTAGARAKARNLLQGDDQAELDLWDTKWIPEGHEYAATVQPEVHADLVVPGRTG
jgi:uridine kinase